MTQRSNSKIRRRSFLFAALTPAFAFSARQSAAQSAAAPKFVESAAVPGIQATALNASDRPFAETLRGTGTKAGYLLTHGNVLPASVFLTIGGIPQKANADYWLETGSGSVYFANPVRSGDSIQITYRYLDGASPAENTLLPGLRFNLGRSASLGLIYGAAASNGAGLNISTYGLSLNSAFGAGQRSSFSSLFYVSNSQQSQNEIMPLAVSAAKTSGPGQQAGSDHLFVQDLNMRAGGLLFHADYQDVGKKFNGFSSLRSNLAGDKAGLDRLGALEGERGVQRLGFGFGTGGGAAGLPNGKTAGLSLNWNQISDEKGRISQQAAGYESKGFHIQFASREIGKTFQSFSGLRDAERDQWKREAGIKTETLGLGFHFGQSKKETAGGGLNFSSQKFGDESGGLKRDTLQIASGNFGLQLMNRSADSGFKRLNDLSDADKNALALDLYRQFDPSARVEQITANDRNQIAHEAGLKRSALRADFGFGKAGGLNFSQMAIADADAKDGASAGLHRDNLTLQSGAARLEYLSQRSDLKFGRSGDLSDIEKTYLALDIRRQFEPNATAAQITPKERDQAKATGITRNALRGAVNFGKGGKNGALSVQQIGLSDTAPNAGNTPPANAKNGLTRQTAEYQNKNLRLIWLNQRIAAGFLRLKDLTDAERAALGNENGLTRQQTGLSWQINKTTKLTVSRLAIGGASDAASLAAANAETNHTDSAAAQKTALAGLRRESLAFETTGFLLAGNTAHTDKEFTRAADLALPDADRRVIEAERGFNRSDWTTKFSLLKWLKFDGAIYNATDDADKAGHATANNNLTLMPTKQTQFDYHQNSDVVTTDGQKNGQARDSLALKQIFGPGIALNWNQDSNTIYDKGVAAAQSTKTDTLRLQTPDAARNSLNYESKNTTYEDGKYERVSNLNVHAKPVSGVAVSYTNLDVARDGDNLSENTDKVDFSWQASKQFAIIGGYAQKNVNDPKDTAKTGKGNSDTVSVGLSGQPVKNITLAAKFDEQHQVSQNTRDAADISISNAKPFAFGPIQEFTLTARYASLNDQRKLQNETMTGRAAWKIWKNQFILDYSGESKLDATTTSRLYSFATDANPKRPFHASFLYKARTMLDGQEMAIRRFTADALLAKSTRLVYTYGTLPEDEHGNIIPQTTIDIAVKHRFGAGRDFGFFYRVNDNTATKLATRSLGFEFSSQINAGSKMSLAFSFDGNRWPDRADHSHYVRLGYERKLSADNYFTLSAEIRKHDAAGVADELRGNFDFHVLF